MKVAVRMTLAAVAQRRDTALVSTADFRQPPPPVGDDHLGCFESRSGVAPDVNVAIIQAS